MEGIENLTTLRKLELYDNQVEQISSLERLSNLVILDLSFNAIREMVPDLVSSCPLLEGTTIVLHCTVLYCTVSDCIVLYCIVLYCIVLYCIGLDWIGLDCIVLY